jgi:hypothetical protein
VNIAEVERIMGSKKLKADLGKLKLPTNPVLNIKPEKI